MCWSYKELTDAQFRITPKTMCSTTCRTWILPSSCPLAFLHLTIHVRYVRGQTMLIKYCFVIIIMVDTIYSASNRSSVKFPLAFGTIHHVLQHLYFYSNHATLLPARSRGGYMRIASQTPLVHCIYMCVHLFLIN